MTPNFYFFFYIPLQNVEAGNGPVRKQGPGQLTKIYPGAYVRAPSRDHTALRRAMQIAALRPR